MGDQRIGSAPRAEGAVVLLKANAAVEATPVAWATCIFVSSCDAVPLSIAMQIPSDVNGDTSVDAKSRRIILVTFAGRRDRMELLIRYATEAIARGLINEWHIWDFTRDPADAEWLRKCFPYVQVTPSQSFEYFHLPGAIPNHNRQVAFSVRATNDVHIGLRRASGSGFTYEIVLGGWANQGSALRRFVDPSALTDMAMRGTEHEPAVYRATPNLLPEFDFVDVAVELGSRGLKVIVQGETLLQHTDGVSDGDFELFYKTGYGANGDWRFSTFKEQRTRLFVGGRVEYYQANARYYCAAYQYYAANAEQFVRDVFLKCDDDIVYIDLDRLGQFIQFRETHQEHFIVSANVINNGVCAHYQQQAGLIPTSLMELEKPARGFGGSLWLSGKKAESLHRYFLGHRSVFSIYNPASILWNERISINFVAWLGRDLVHIPDVMEDDEHDLCYGVRKRARKTNCIYLPFIVSHLSFFTQDREMNIPEVIASYDSLATHCGLASRARGKVETWPARGSEAAQIRVNKARVTDEPVIRPNDIAAINNSGRELQKLNRLEEALAQYDMAISIKADDVTALSCRGNVLFDLGRFDAALANYDKLLAVRPNDARALNMRGLILEVFKRPEEALASYDKAVAAAPEVIEALYNRGNILADLARFEEALASYDKALAVVPDAAPVLNNRGLVLEELRRFKEALASYEKALKIKPGYGAAANNRRLVLEEIERFAHGGKNVGEAVIFPDMEASEFVSVAIRATAMLEYRGQAAPKNHISLRRIRTWDEVHCS
jgi:tetratricopeptide (TPR) repeat protein